MALWPQPSTADAPDRRIEPPAGTTGRSWHAWRDPSTKFEALRGCLTLEEKIGQVTLVSASRAVRGTGGPVDYVQAIHTGAIGAVSNPWDPVQTRGVQRVALEATRLGIPPPFVMDGHRSVGVFAPAPWRRMARRPQ
jgi:beta-glucosidase